MLERMLAGDTASGTNADRAAVALVHGELSLAEGDAATAVDGFARAVELNGVTYEREGLARALVAAGRAQEALRAFQATLADSTIGWEVQEPWVLAHFELAALYDALGDSTAALPLYRRLAEQWQEGDASIPILQQIRRRLRQGG